MGQDVAQRGRDQVVERAALLRQGQVEQPLAQGVGERLPDRARRQRGEVVGDAVHERVRGAAKCLFAHGASIGTVASTASPRLALLLAMAMFVLVVDTSLMNVSISSVVRDLDTTVSGVQSAIALEALVSAAFILIGSKVGDLFGRKRAYVLGLLGYAIGAIAMVLAQDLLAIVIFWAVIGGLGASLLLPSMQSLIHGNFEGAAQKKVYALVGASAAIAAAVGPLIGGFITTYLSWRVAFLLEVVVIAVVLFGIRRVHDVPYTGPRRVDPVGAALSVLGMGGVVLGILVWQEGGEAVARCWRSVRLALGIARLVAHAAQARGKPTLIDPELFRSKPFRIGDLGPDAPADLARRLMIALPISYTAQGINPCNINNDPVILDQILAGLNLNLVAGTTTGAGVAGAAPGSGTYTPVGTVNSAGIYQSGAQHLRRSTTFDEELAEGDFDDVADSLIALNPTCAQGRQAAPINPLTGTALGGIDLIGMRNGCDRIANGFTIVQQTTPGGSQVANSGAPIPLRCFPEDFLASNPQFSTRHV